MMHILLFFSRCRLFHNTIFFGSCKIHILNTECANILKKIPAPKSKELSTVRVTTASYQNNILQPICIDQSYLRSQNWNI